MAKLPHMAPFRRLHLGPLVQSTIYLIQDIICENFFDYLPSLLTLDSKRIQSHIC